MSLLTMISGSDQGAAVLCGVNAPAAIINSTDPNVPLLLACAQQEGRELARRHEWQALKIDYTVNTVATEAQTALPSDFDRFVHGAEIWNQTTSQRYTPASDKIWSRIKGLNFTAGANAGWWRLIGGVLHITPAPVAGQTLAFTYISKNWCQSNVDVGQSSWMADSDTGVLDESLMVLGIIWRWRKKRGFDYAEEMSDYERAVEIASSRDGGFTESILLKRGNIGMDDYFAYSWPGTVTDS